MRKILLLIPAILAFQACTVDKKTVGQLLKDNPEILTDAIKENPDKFITALNDAVKVAQAGQRKKREEEEKRKEEEK